jgi:16S rRNA (cytosine967-C5)-methyltransferase
LRCFKDDAFADRALSSALSKSSLAGADRALAAEIVYGVLRHGRALDFALTQLTSLERASLPTTLALRVGAYELMHLRTPEYAAVNEAVSLVKPEAQRRFVNGVLRTLARRRDSLAQPTANASVSELSALAIRTTTPEWLLRELLETCGNRLDEVEAWALATQQRPPLALRVNRLRASPTELSASLRSVGATIAEGMPLSWFQDNMNMIGHDAPCK